MVMRWFSAAGSGFRFMVWITPYLKTFLLVCMPTSVGVEDLDSDR